MTAAKQKSLAECGKLHELFLSFYENGLHAGVIHVARVAKGWGAPWRALLFGFHPKLSYLPTGPMRLTCSKPKQEISEAEWLRWLASEELPAPPNISAYRVTCRELLIQWLEHNGRFAARAALESRDCDGFWTQARRQSETKEHLHLEGGEGRLHLVSGKKPGAELRGPDE